MTVDNPSTLLRKAHSVVLPMIRVSEEDVIEPEGWVDQWHLDPVLSLLPVQPPEVNTFSLPRTKDYLKPVADKLDTITRFNQL